MALISDANSRNIVVALDNVQAKLLIGILRTITVPQLVEASNEVQGAGFAVFATDAEAARSSFVSVLGQYLNTMVHVSKLPAQPPPTTRVKSPEPGEEPPPKEYLN